MSKAMTQEEILACELINYIEAKPNHAAGLCYYLGDKNAHDHPLKDNLLIGSAYQLIHLVRQTLLTKYGNHTYVTGNYNSGPTNTRIQFAKDLLKLVCVGKVYFDTNTKYWEIR